MAVQVASFTVNGKPVPQGSKTVFMVKGKPVLADANSKELKPWRQKVAQVALHAASHVSAREVPVAVHAVFTFERPKTVKREYPTVKPDLDKLIRSVFDAITDAGLWADDCQVVDMRVTKQYGERPGVQVRVGEIREGEQG
ncbi:RusA family crossover junction endodeoxyribonuclease [Leifsonia sp. NPDC056824]|uniref:RusA family crossover junction endodeoxyribonuclease n=1 Tax=Leifsonia sp. NPDC056824 TaxID=3345953 RepID=UPI0036B0243F